MFFLKKFIAALLLPVALCAALLGLGLVLALFTKRRKTGNALLAAGGMLFILFSLNPVGDALLGPLKREYPPPVDPSAAFKEGGSRPRWVAVLGGGYTDDPALSATSRHSEASLFRLIEGIRLHRALAGSRLLLSGGNFFGGKTEGEGMRELALALGVEGRAIAVENRSRNTRDQAVYIKKIVGGDPFVLVTSASHMPRAMGMFRKEGMAPLPAPVDHMVKKGNSPAVFRWIPSVDALKKANRAIYEYLGLAWARLRGQIG